MALAREQPAAAAAAEGAEGGAAAASGAPGGLTLFFVPVQRDEERRLQVGVRPASGMACPPAPVLQAMGCTVLLGCLAAASSPSRCAPMQPAAERPGGAAEGQASDT